MDTQQLKLLADRLRVFLEHRKHPIKHGHALDVIAALPGLRNWPEVVAFPETVAAADCFTIEALERLSGRLRQKHEISVDTHSLFEAVTLPAPPQANVSIWPEGPEPGVYVTTSKTAIDALIARYEREAEGAVLYAESAGALAESAIELGDYGVFSGGLMRAPSGTLIVLGPLELAQETWAENRNRVMRACDLAGDAGFRVAILCSTPQPDSLRSDVALLAEDEKGLADANCLAGVVEDDGALRRLQPFAHAVSLSAPARAEFSPQRLLPEPALAALTTPAANAHGVVIIATTGSDEGRYDAVAAALQVIAPGAPVARIQPHFRSSIDRAVSGIEALEVLPSIESAYRNGYRYVVMDNAHSTVDTICEYARKMSFVIPAYASDVATAFSRPFGHSNDKAAVQVRATRAIICVTHFATKRATHCMCDTYVASDQQPNVAGFMEAHDYLLEHRSNKWEDDLSELLATKAVTEAAVRRAAPNNYDIKEFLSRHRQAARSLATIAFVGPPNLQP